MTATSDVRFWDVRRNRSSQRPSYEVRWVVAGRQRSATRRTKALAEALLSDLRQAARRGEPFDLASGLPQSMLAAGSKLTWYGYVLGVCGPALARGGGQHSQEHAGGAGDGHGGAGA